MAQGRQSSNSGTAWPLACAATLLIWMLARLATLSLHGQLSADPDAYYTLVIARNLVEHGRLSFDGQTLTNGFSPLWLAGLALQQKLVGASLTVTFALEAAMLSVSLFVLLRCLNVANRLFQVAFTAAFAWLAYGFGMSGLDASLLILCISLFVAALSWETESLVGGLALAAAAVLCLATRLEAAWFVGPALLLGPSRLANRVLALTLFAAAVIGYGAVNLRYFGGLLPISSQVHALGGAQINHALIAQMGAAWAIDGASSRQILLCLALLAAPGLAFVAPRGTAAAALCAAAGLGGWIVLVSLMLGSSWTMGASFGATAIWPLLALFWTVAPPLSDALHRLHVRLGSPRLAQPAVAGLSGLVLAGLLGQSALAASAGAPAARTQPADPVRALLAAHAASLAGQRIAMGAGAGALADAYRGSVIGLEGAAGDRAYLTALMSGGDMTPMLCARNVKFIAAYTPPLGDYGRRRFAALDPSQTGFGGATVDIDHRDEIAKIAVGGGRELRVWRLGACWRNGYAPAA
jgi:hypothetical protein